MRCSMNTKFCFNRITFLNYELISSSSKPVKQVLNFLCLFMLTVEEKHLSHQYKSRYECKPTYHYGVHLSPLQLCPCLPNFPPISHCFRCVQPFCHVPVCHSEHSAQLVSRKFIELSSLINRDSRLWADVEQQFPRRSSKRNLL